jgi:hypothetical protein
MPLTIVAKEKHMGGRGKGRELLFSLVTYQLTNVLSVWNTDWIGLRMMPIDSHVLYVNR